MASRARARSTCAAGALNERLRRVSSLRSAAMSGRRGSFRWRDTGHLEARGRRANIPDLTANNPLGHRISHTVVGELLKREGFSLQANRKTREGEGHPDRDAQFAHINARVAQAMAEKQPVISVDTKKKELVGDFKNAGREWRPSGDPEAVRVHDFLIKALGRAVPYGVYDLAANAGWVSVGIDHDTAAFAVQTIRSWWQEVGNPRYPG